MLTNTATSALVAGLVLAAQVQGQIVNQSSVPTLLLAPDDEFNFVMDTAFGEAIYGGADINPILGVAKDLLAYPGNLQKWSSVWYALANDTKAKAQDPENAYDPINVRDTWFSAATYFRHADFFNHYDWLDPRINEYWDEQTYCFNQGLASLPVPGQRIQIPTNDGFTVEAIWYAPEAESYNGAQEDLYHTLVVPGLARGWNIITYEGPGQPTVRRNQNIGFIPEWEKVVTPVVDWLLAPKANVVDETPLALFGYSFGGELAARVAAYEHRFVAVILDPAVYSFYDSMTATFVPALLKIFDSGNKTEFDGAVTEGLSSPEAPTRQRWAIAQGLWSFKITSPFDWVTAIKQYNITNLTNQIKGPVFIMDAEYEPYFAGQSQLVKQALGDKADLHIFNGTAGYHCQVGALQSLNRVMWAWLHKKLY